jgi:hypothetical protein
VPCAEGVGHDPLAHRTGEAAPIRRSL